MCVCVCACAVHPVVDVVVVDVDEEPKGAGSGCSGLGCFSVSSSVVGDAAAVRDAAALVDRYDHRYQGLSCTHADASFLRMP